MAPTFDRTEQVRLDRSSSDDGAGAGGVRLTVLGTGGGWARPNGAASGYLLQEDGFNLWVDAGTGTMANLQRHVGLLDVHAVVVSHQHFDHFLDLYPYFLARQYAPGEHPPAIPFFAPPGMFDHARRSRSGWAMRSA